MHFELTQRFAAPLRGVATAFTDPDYYETLAELPKLGRPDVLSRKANGAQITMRIRYAFNGELSSAVRAVLDPAKLTWVEESVHDLDTHRVTFVQVPDHYAERFTCRGNYRFRADGTDHTVRAAAGDVKVRAPFVAASVERAIISGLTDHLKDEVDLLERWLEDQGEA